MSEDPIKAEDLIEEIVSLYPQTVRVFMDHGLPCLVCGEPLWGTVAENAERYKADLTSLLKDLNATALESEQIN